MDIFDGASGSWHSEKLSAQREFPVVAVADSKVFIMGSGSEPASNIDVVDVYDAG